MAKIKLREWASKRAIEQLDKINKRAEKLSLPPVSYSVSPRYLKPEPRLPVDHIFYDSTDLVGPDVDYYDRRCEQGRVG